MQCTWKWCYCFLYRPLQLRIIDHTSTLPIFQAIASVSHGDMLPYDACSNQCHDVGKKMNTSNNEKHMYSVQRISLYVEHSCMYKTWIYSNNIIHWWRQGNHYFAHCLVCLIDLNTSRCFELFFHHWTVHAYNWWLNLRFLPNYALVSCAQCGWQLFYKDKLNNHHKQCIECYKLWGITYGINSNSRPATFIFRTNSTFYILTEWQKSALDGYFGYSRFKLF